MKSLDLILSLPKDEAWISAFFSILLLVGPIMFGVLAQMTRTFFLLPWGEGQDEGVHPHYQALTPHPDRSRSGLSHWERCICIRT